jgi:hypothetical protein
MLTKTARARHTVPMVYDPELVAALLASYARLLGSALMPEGADAAHRLYHADFAVLAHDTQADPCFTYVNLTAQRWFEHTLVGMPSRLSAEAPARAERARLLAEVEQQGFSRDYRGLRVAASGRRFWIERAIVWNVTGLDGTRRGQAATFAHTSAA